MKFDWNKFQSSFEQLKKIFVEAPVLTQPSSSKEYALYSNASKIGVEYIKVQHLYRILIPLAHVLLQFCVRIGAFDRLLHFVLVQVFRVLCTLSVGVHVQITNVDHCS